MVKLTDVDPEESTRSFGEAMRKALRSLLSASTVPLRLAVILASTGCVLGVLALIYVIVIFLTLKTVQPGWTTLSILMAGMLIIFSGLFVLLTVYMLAMYSSIQPRARLPIVRELRSNLRRHAMRVNVVDTSRTVRLGAPSPGMPDVRP